MPMPPSMVACSKIRRAGRVAGLRQQRDSFSMAGLPNAWLLKISLTPLWHADHQSEQTEDMQLEISASSHHACVLRGRADSTGSRVKLGNYLTVPRCGDTEYSGHGPGLQRRNRVNAAPTSSR